jgi:CBS domain-containing protein
MTESSKGQGWRSIYDITWDDLMSNTPVGSILRPRDILVAPARENVESLLQRLRNNGLRSAVVYDTNSLFIGFVDASDIAVHILDVIHWTRDITTETFRSLDWQGQRFASEDSGNLMNLSNMNAFQTVSLQTPIRNVVELMANGYHRVAVVNEGTIVNVVSQWDVLLLILARIFFLGTEIEKTVAGSKLFSGREVLVVPDSIDVIEALKFMYDNRISGLPLVDDNGRITQNFSTTDLLGLTAQNFPQLSLNLKDFLFRTYGYVKPPVVCRRTDSVESVLLKYSTYGVHRVYVVDDNFRPIGVITLTDVMRFLLNIDQKRSMPQMEKPMEVGAK